MVPTYQSVAFAERCLRSIVGQQGVRAEVIVSDDSATGEVRGFIERFAAEFPQVRYVPGARTGNPVDNWNAGLDEATAPYAVLIHHDEYLADPGYLRRAVDALEAGPEGGGGKVVTAAHALAGEGGRTWFAAASRTARLLRLPVWTLHLAQWIGPTAAVVFPTQGRLRFDPRLAWTVDADFYVRLIPRRRDIVRDEAVCVVSTRHPGQITARVDRRALAVRELRLLAATSPGRLRPWQWRFVIAFAELRLKLDRGRG